MFVALFFVPSISLPFVQSIVLFYCHFCVNNVRTCRSYFASACSSAQTAVISSKHSFHFPVNQIRHPSLQATTSVPSQGVEFQRGSCHFTPQKWCQSQENVENVPLFFVTWWLKKTCWLKLPTLSVCPISSSEHFPATCVSFALCAFFVAFICAALFNFLSRHPLQKNKTKNRTYYRDLSQSLQPLQQPRPPKITVFQQAHTRRHHHLLHTLLQNKPK